ncbi:NAD(P)H-dependent oxidoreductase [Azohydromonas lata]|uniref:NAD(P)H-dependent oxidoreductase n=1 Tax=Azohydromonas lata TaxID=45677 RepID=A0ABU5IMI7_9BURK|nr:NAD(P)H-dependent oxidoreductase [Azohydromonas lata]MDZ5460103.1 NAD(P)H-dependent oxidoreductase [Azohydromonas lata]
MNVLIVHAHPEPKSFCAAMCLQATQQLRLQGHQVRVSDLYAMKFNPVAGAEDFGERCNPDYLVYALEQRHGQERGTLAADIRAEIAKLLWCDLLILNFPVFWFSTPAILKGWIDRVLVSGLVYGGKRFYDRGGLAGKRAMLAVTLGGQPHMFGPQGIHGPLEDMLGHLLRGTLAYTGMTVLPPFVAWHVPYVTAQARARILQDYREALLTLDARAPLPFPNLDDYDDRLMPLPQG